MLRKRKTPNRRMTVSNKNLSTGKETITYTIIGKPEGRIYLTYKDIGGYDGIPVELHF